MENISLCTSFGDQAATSVKIRPTSMLLEVEIPVLEQVLRDSLSRKPLAIVGLKLNLSIVPEDASSQDDDKPSQGPDRLDSAL
jgi:hypothetical protein